MEQKNDKSVGKLIILGIQHVFAMFGATVLVPALTGLNPSVALLCAGLATIAYHLITKRKVPTFLGSSFAFIAGIIHVAESQSGVAFGTFAAGSPEAAAYAVGLQYACGGIVAAGAVYVLFAIAVKIFGTGFVRRLFPPVVTGCMIIIIGMMLAPTALSNITTPVQTGVTEVAAVAEEGAEAVMEAVAVNAPMWKNWAVAVITIFAIVCISLMAKGIFKLVPILLGIIIGYAAAVCFGLVNFEAIQNASWVVVPPVFLPKFSWQAVGMIAPIAIVTFVEHIGDVNASSEVVGKDFMTDPGLHRTLLGDGIGTMLAGCMGGPANTTYSENTGVLAATKNYNPVTLEIAAVFAVIIAFFGKLGAVLQTIPGPVLGGVSVVLFGMIAAVGLRTLVENGVDFKLTRNLLIASVMLVFGLGGLTIDVGEVSISGTAIAAILGLLLNLILPKEIEQKN